MPASHLTPLLDERHGCTDRQLVERVVQHTRAVEIDPVLAGLDEPEPVGPFELDHFTVRRDLVRLDGPTLLTGDVLQPSAGRIERLTDCDGRVAVHALDLAVLAVFLLLEILQSPVKRRFVTRHNRRYVGNRQVDTHVNVSAIVAMSMREFDDDVTARDAGVELFQPGHTLANGGVEGVRMRQTAKGHLCRDQSHRCLAYTDARRSASDSS